MLRAMAVDFRESEDKRKRETESKTLAQKTMEGELVKVIIT